MTNALSLLVVEFLLSYPVKATTKKASRKSVEKGFEKREVYCSAILPHFESNYLAYIFSFGRFLENDDEKKMKTTRRGSCFPWRLHLFLVEVLAFVVAAGCVPPTRLARADFDLGRRKKTTSTGLEEDSLYYRNGYYRTVGCH